MHQAPSMVPGHFVRGGGSARLTLLPRWALQWSGRISGTPSAQRAAIYGHYRELQPDSGLPIRCLPVVARAGTRSRARCVQPSAKAVDVAPLSVRQGYSTHPSFSPPGAFKRARQLSERCRKAPVLDLT